MVISEGSSDSSGSSDSIQFTTPASERYAKTVWATGDIVSSEKLNNIENALSNLLPMFVHVNPETKALDHAWNEIHEALASRVVVMCFEMSSNRQVDENTYEESSYRVQTDITSAQVGENTYMIAGDADERLQFQCSDPDDYPVFMQQEGN